MGDGGVYRAFELHVDNDRQLLLIQLGSEIGRAMVGGLFADHGPFFSGG